MRCCGEAEAATMTVYADCPSCHGSGYFMGGDEYQECSSCRLRTREADRIRAAHEASVEAAYRDAGYGALSPLEQRAADGDR